MNCRILILAALLPEARAFARAFRLNHRFPKAASDGDVAVGLVGPRCRNLVYCMGDIHAQAIIMAGLAGGLSPELKVGDIVAQGAVSPTYSGPRFTAGGLHTAREIVSTPQAKSLLHRTTGALAVDMETQHAQAFAQKTNVPFLAVRAISDTAAETLDPVLMTLIDEHGRPRTGRALRHILRNPARLPSLLRTGRAAKHALSQLSAFLVALVASGWPDPASFRQNPKKVDWHHR